MWLEPIAWQLPGLAVVEGRAQADGDARQSADRLDAAQDLRGVKGALIAQEARGEVGDLDGVAAAVLQDRLDDRRCCARRPERACRRPVAVHDHVAEALLLVAREQAREHRIAIEAGKAPPDDAPVGVDEGGDAPVADRGELEAYRRERDSWCRPFFWRLKRALMVGPSQGRTDHCRIWLLPALAGVGGLGRPLGRARVLSRLWHGMVKARLDSAAWLYVRRLWRIVSARIACCRGLVTEPARGRA